MKAYNDTTYQCQDKEGKGRKISMEEQRVKMALKQEDPGKNKN